MINVIQGFARPRRGCLTVGCRVACLRPSPHTAPTRPGPGGDPLAPGRRGAALVGRGPARIGRSRTRHSPTGRSPGVAASRSHTTSAITRRRSRAAGSSTSHRAPDLVAIAAMNAGASAVIASDIDPFAAVAIGLNARANHDRITRPGAATSSTSRHRTWTLSSRATAGTRRASPSVSCLAPGASALPGSTSSSATRAAAISRRPLSRSSPRTRSGPRPSSRISTLKTGRVFTLRDQ